MEKSSNILQELESDDEFPDIFNDISIQPAYMNDNRFDEIKFPWLNNVSLFKNIQMRNHFYEDEFRKFHCKGMLSQQDLYCIKSVEPFTCSNTLIWLVNFLLHKDLQSHYNFLKSCLVNDVTTTIPFINKKYTPNKEASLRDLGYEIIIKA